MLKVQVLEGFQPFYDMFIQKQHKTKVHIKKELINVRFEIVSTSSLDKQSRFTDKQ